MELTFPTYRISKKSSTDDLRILENLYSEIGGFASTILDNRYLAFSKECVKRLNKVVAILNGRKECKFEKVAEHIDANVNVDLSALTIDELYHFYRRWSERHKKRALDGREHMTFYFEGHIVRELLRRNVLTESERLKVDYCKMTYRSELENMSFIYSVPVGNQPELTAPEKDKTYSVFELVTLLNRYSSYTTIAERELLVEYVDKALDLMQAADDKAVMMGVAAEIVELGRRDVVKVPVWTVDFLAEAIEQARKDSRITESELVLPLLTLNLRNRSSKIEREACSIINRCYRTAMDGEADLDKRIENLHTAVMCCDYVTRFSVRKVAAVWNELTAQALSNELSVQTLSAEMSAQVLSNEFSAQTLWNDKELKTKQIFRLLEVAKECEDYAPINIESKNRLQHFLEDLTHSEIPEAMVLNEIAKTRF